MARQKRIPNGRPIEGTDVVAVDAVAVLAGVNFSSVVKVFAAIEAIRIHTGATPEEIVKFANAPTEKVLFDGNYEQRIKAADALLHDIVNNEAVDFLDYVLRQKARFGEAPTTTQ